MIRHVPAVVSARYGDGTPLEVAVAGELRHPTHVLALDGRVIAVVDESGAWWDDYIPRRVRAAPADVRRELGRNGRLTAALDERGTVLAFRVTPR